MRRQNESAHWLSKHTHKRARACAHSIPIFALFLRSLTYALVSFIRHLTSIPCIYIDLHCHIIDCLFPIVQFTFHELNCINYVQHQFQEHEMENFKKKKWESIFLILLTLILNRVPIIINWNDWESLGNYVFAA